jgi:hypothetical protein
MELRKAGCFTSVQCRTKHQSWSCEKRDDLQMKHLDDLQVAGVRVRVGVEKNWMLYHCSL